MPKVGDRIRIPSLKQTADVLAVNDHDRSLTVRFGVMKMTVALDDIESLDGEKVTNSEERPSTPSARQSGFASQRAADSAKGQQGIAQEKPTASDLTIRTSQNTLDLRGSRVIDAEPLLDKALAEGDRVVWIIHGHGTGKLRQGVHEFLKQHPRVERFALAAQQDGGSGVTIAYLTE